MSIEVSKFPLKYNQKATLSGVRNIHPSDLDSSWPPHWGYTLDTFLSPSAALDQYFSAFTAHSTSVREEKWEMRNYCSFGLGYHSLCAHPMLATFRAVFLLVSHAYEIVCYCSPHLEKLGKWGLDNCELRSWESSSYCDILSKLVYFRVERNIK